MSTRLVSVGLLAALVACPAAAAQTSPPDKPATGCMACHQGIEPIRQPGSEMLEEILALGQSRGDPAGCVVCHGGDVTANDKETAHQGDAFYPDPGSPWINKNTCRQCHPEHVRVQWHSLMMTEAGKIHGVSWTFGSLTGYQHRWGNYDVQNPTDKKQRLETVDGQILARSARTQLEPIEGLLADWSRLVTEDGQQLQTVGHHFSRSRPLDNEERRHIDRQGVCLACHQEIPDRSLAVSLLHHVAEFTDQLPETGPQHNSLIHKILLLSAWIQVAGMLGVPLAALAALAGIVWYLRRKKRRAAAAGVAWVEPEEDGCVEPEDDGCVEPEDDGCVEPEDDGWEV